MTLHAHVETSSTDCDGTYTSSYVATFNDEEVAESQKEVNDFSDIHFVNRVFANVAGPYATLRSRIEIDETGFEKFEDTEEGGRWAQVKWCHDETCIVDEHAQRGLRRDHRAEAAGY